MWWLSWGIVRGEEHKIHWPFQPSFWLPFFSLRHTYIIFIHNIHTKMNAPEWHWFECFLSRLRKFCSVEIGDFDHVWVWLKMLWAGAWMNNSGACKDLILRVSALCLRSQHTHCFMIQRHVWTFHHLHAFKTILFFCSPFNVPSFCRCFGEFIKPKHPIWMLGRSGCPWQLGSPGVPPLCRKSLFTLLRVCLALTWCARRSQQI